MEAAARKTRLVLKRSEGEAVWIGDVRIVMGRDGKMIIEAPESTRVIREELINRPKSA
jgi:sRNA-binding carbon storage regulator CsrA